MDRKIRIAQAVIVLLTLLGCRSLPAARQPVGGDSSAVADAGSPFEVRALGESTRSDHLITYAVPPEFPFEGAPLFTIKVDGHYTGVYNDINAWDKRVSFGYFDLHPGREVEVEIDCARPFQDYAILPDSSGIASTRRGQTIRFTLKRSRAVTIVFDGDYQGNVLHVFANAIDENAPTASSDNLIYFGPGYHDLGGVLRITDDREVYIAGGAVVSGTLSIDQADGARVSGRGMLMRTEPQNVVLSIGFSRNVTLDGILIHNHRCCGWTTAMHAVANVAVRNVKVVSTRYASTDGFDIVNSQGIRFKNVFIRSCDDAIAIKGLIEGRPADCPPNEDMLFESLQIWNDCNNAMCMGAETRAARYRHITFRNIDVLYSYDDRDHHTELDERSVMTIVCLQGTFFRDIRFEDIRVNRCQRLICLTFKDSFWFGSLRGDQTTEGGIEGVVFEDITSAFDSGSPIGNDILLNGWLQEGTPTKLVRDITFDNVRIEGRILTGETDDHIQTNNSPAVTLVDTLKFRP